MQQWNVLVFFKGKRPSLNTNNFLRFDIQILLIIFNIILLYGSQTYLTETKIIISLENSCLSFCLWSFRLAVLMLFPISVGMLLPGVSFPFPSQIYYQFPPVIFPQWGRIPVMRFCYPPPHPPPSPQQTKPSTRAPQHSKTSARTGKKLSIRAPQQTI